MEVLQNYIMPELLVLIPVLYLIGIAVKNSKISDRWIPLILGGASVILCGIWVFANCPIGDAGEVATALFTALTQGVLIAGASVYANQIVKQATKGGDDNGTV